MVVRKNLKNKFALISVYNKNGLKSLCENLIKYNYKFISTGSTAKKIKSYGFECLEISKLTKFKEILNGRVKTLNPKIYGSILFKRENKEHLKEFKNLNHFRKTAAHVLYGSNPLSNPLSHSLSDFDFRSF